MHISASDVCRKDLYTPKDVLLQKYPADTVEKVIRVRDIHQRLIADPTANQTLIVEDIVKFYGVTKQAAYSDLRIVKQLLPTLTESRRNFHRWRANEMMLETYRMAKEKEDLATMERVASSYAKYNKIDQEDDADTLLERMPPQPFVQTVDPSVLGIAPIPNLQERIKALYEKYSRETPEIEDVQYEEADLLEDELFPKKQEIRDAGDEER